MGGEGVEGKHDGCECVPNANELAQFGPHGECPQSIWVIRGLGKRYREKQPLWTGRLAISPQSPTLETRGSSPHYPVFLRSDCDEYEWGQYPAYLLSYYLGIVTCFGLEGTVIGPEVYRVGDAGDTSFIHLKPSARLLIRFMHEHTISAASVPAIENSRSAYFFQYPKKRGNFARNRS